MKNDEYENSIKQLMEWAGQAVEFSKEQMPAVAAEILSYNASVDMFWLAMWGSVLVINLVVLAVLWTRKDSCAIVCGFLAVISFFAIGLNYTDLLKVQNAPKLYIMDELRDRLLPKK